MISGVTEFEGRYRVWALEAPKDIPVPKHTQTFEQAMVPFYLPCKFKTKAFADLCSQLVCASDTNMEDIELLDLMVTHAKNIEAGK